MLIDLLSYPLVAIVFLLAAIIFIHEFGHYLFAKLFGVGVEVFSFGFGPVLFSFKAFGTLYKIAAFPLGGYVKLAGSFEGEEVPDDYKGQELFRATHLQKILILAAGPAFNFFLAIFIYMSLSLSGIKTVESIIGVVKKDSPAEFAGLRSGDKVLKINGESLETWTAMSQAILESAGKSLDIVYERGDKRRATKVIPETFEAKSHKGGKEKFGRIGIAPVFWAPIITVKDKESFAYKLGLRTGDSINAVEYFHKPTKKVVFKEIKSWHELESLFENEIFQKNVEKQILFVSKEALEEPSKGKKENRRIELNLALADFRKSKKVSLLRSLGLGTSELTFVKKLGEKNPKEIKDHDILVSFNGNGLRDIFDLNLLLKENKKEKANLGLMREGKLQIVVVNLKPIERQLPSGKETFYTLEASFLAKTNPLPIKLEKSGTFFEAFFFGVKESFKMSAMMLESLWGLITGKVPLAAVGGPILIAKAASDSIKVGFDVFFKMMALISLNLAIVNLIPIPILDGGRIIVVALEWVRGKPLSLKALENFQKVGFVLVFSLFVLATYNDLSRFWASIIREIMGA